MVLAIHLFFSPITLEMYRYPFLTLLHFFRCCT